MISMRVTRFITVVALTAATHQAFAQIRPDSTVTRRPPGLPQGRVQALSQGLTPNRDVILEVPELSVDSIGLTVSDVKAHVSLDANAMNLVQLSAGVDVGIKKVQLGIVGVYGEVYLYADLDNVARIVDRVVATLDRNPKILTQVLAAVDTTVNAALPRRR
jgi:hypothetical protein